MITDYLLKFPSLFLKSGALSNLFSLLHIEYAPGPGTLWNAVLFEYLPVLLLENVNPLTGLIFFKLSITSYLSGEGAHAI